LPSLYGWLFGQRFTERRLQDFNIFALVPRAHPCREEYVLFRNACQLRRGGADFAHNPFFFLGFLADSAVGFPAFGLSSTDLDQAL
jgi:hypothetical protein